MVADSEFSQPPLRSKSSDHPPNAASLRPFYSISGWTRLIQTMLFISMGFSIASIVLALTAFEQVQNVNRSSHDARALQETGGAINTVAFLLLIPVPILGLALVAWIYNAYANLPALDADDTLFSPGIAVLLCMIPGINFVTPFFVLRELWCASDPAPLVPTGRSRNSATIVVLWWLMLLLTNTGGAVASFWRNQVTQPSDLIFMLVMQIGVSGLAIVQNALLFWIVNVIRTNQEERRFLVLSPPKSVPVTRIPEFPEEPKIPTTE